MTSAEDPEDALGRLARELGEQPLDDNTRQALAAARARAVERSAARGQRSWLPAGLLPGSASWLPAAAAAGIAGLAALVLLRGPAGPALAEEDAALIYVYAEEDVAVAEDLDFLAWLDAQETGDIGSLGREATADVEEHAG